MNIKHIVFLGFALLSCTSSMMGQQVGINTTEPDESAYLDISGTSKGLLPPRLDSVDRSNLDGVGPANGLVLYNTDEEALQVNEGTKENPNWVSLGKNGSGITTIPTAGEKWIYFPVVPLAMFLDGSTTSAYNLMNLYEIYLRDLATPLGLTYTRDQLTFAVLDYDKTCFNIVAIVETTGTNYDDTLMWMPRPNDVTDASYLNIGIKITE